MNSLCPLVCSGPYMEPFTQQLYLIPGGPQSSFQSQRFPSAKSQQILQLLGIGQRLLSTGKWAAGCLNARRIFS